MLAAIRVRLILLTLIVAIPLIAANLFVINRLASEQSEAQKQTLIATTRALAAAVDAELKKYAVVGRSLGTSVPLEERNFERFHRQALEASAPLPGAWVVVADVQGQQLVNTLRVFGEKLPMVVPLEVHRRALQTGIEQIGGVLVGPVVQRPALGVFVPVFKGGKAEFNIVIGLDPRVFTRVLENQRLPEGWVAGIGDPQGNFVARSIENDRYVGKPISSGWLAASRSESEGHVENISQEGIPLSSAFSNLTSSGWTVSVGASKEVLNSPVRKSLWIVAAVSSALAWCYLHYPAQESAQADVEWVSGKIPAQDGLLARASKKLIAEEGLITELGPARLDRDLQKYIWNGKPHLRLKDLREYLNRYVYLPRMKSQDVLIKAVLAAVSGMLPGPFAYAERWDEKSDTYLSLVIERAANAAIVIDGDSLIVNPDVAETHRLAPAQPGSTGRSEGQGDKPSETAGQPTDGAPGDSPAEKKPTRFTGTVMISADRPARNMHQIVEAIVEQLTTLPGSRVKLKLEIEADVPAGLDRAKVRTLVENANTLGFIEKSIE